MKKVLFHACCGPCASVILDGMEDGGDCAFLFYNPFIHPYKEYEQRLKSFESFMRLKKQIYYIERAYEIYMPVRKNTSTKTRCRKCYESRLDIAVDRAAELGYPSFSTTLLASPYQQHDLIVEIGRRVGRAKGIEFFYKDFRPGFSNHKTNVLKHDLYLQKYCGCLYSEYERYKKTPCSR